MTFPDLLRALGYEPRAYSGICLPFPEEPCFAVDSTAIAFAAAVVAHEADSRLDPDARTMAVRAIRGAKELAVDSGCGVLTYFPSERTSGATGLDVYWGGP